MKSLFSAFGFLTIFPIPAGWCGDEKSLARSVAWFPVVGLLMGLIWALAGWLLGAVFAPAISAAILLLLLQMMSGGLHVDGLADTADGFLSSRKPERMLEIMRDSRSGPMGVAAIVFLLIAQYAALVALPEGYRLGALLMAPIAGRCAIIIAMTVLRYARPTGIVSIFAPRSKWFLAYAVVILLGAAYALLCVPGLCAASGTLLGLALFCRICKNKIGGFTGDTLGAGCIGAETFFLLLMNLHRPVIVLSHFQGCWR